MGAYENLRLLRNIIHHRFTHINYLIHTYFFGLKHIDYNK